MAWLKLILPLWLFYALFLAGCERPDANVTMLFDRVISPAITKAVSETVTRTAQIQGTATGVEPGYATEFEGYWVIGVKGRVDVFLRGVSGNLQAAAQADRSAEPAPELSPP